MTSTMPKSSPWLKGKSGKMYSNAEDPNDPGRLKEELEKLQIEGKPSGAKYQDSDNENKKYARFVTFTPPDVTRNTRIVAICGITQAEADPTIDGWFFSDFCAFWHLFHDQTIAQTWIHCLDLEALLKKYIYLHGNPFTDRKVVFDQKIYDQMKQTQHPLHQAKPAGFRLKLRQKLRSEYNLAEKNNERLLVMIFGHGYTEGKGIMVGKEKLSASEIARELPGKVDVTLLTTACFSGGWICSPNLNLTAMTAANEEIESVSWTKSSSLGRFSGSPFATMIIERLSADPETQEQLDDTLNDITDSQQASYSHFTNQCYKTLLEKIDRRGYQHQIIFTAQDDQWEDYWRMRAGIPLADFKARWDQLESYGPDPALHPGDPQNRDPNVSEEIREEYLKLKAEDIDLSESTAMVYAPFEASGDAPSQRKLRSSYRGSFRGFHHLVWELCREFFDSYPGEWETANNTGLFTKANRILEMKIKDEATTLEVHGLLQYRLEQMTIADGYVKQMGIPFPENKRCHEFNHVAYRRKNSGIPKYAKIYEMLRECGLYVLFPSPPLEQGWHSEKGYVYLIAAIDYSGISSADAKLKIQELVASVKSEVDIIESAVVEVKEVKNARKRMFESFNKFLASPRKRRSTASGR